VGIWDFFDSDGELEKKYDYSKKEFIFLNLKDDEINKDYTVYKGNQVLTTKLERPPVYLGSTEFIYSELAKKIYYPAEARMNGITGEVLISFIVDSTGKSANYRVFKGIGYGCDEEALKAVYQLPDLWAPGILDKRYVSVKYLMPVRFTLR
jgi:protein TonB